MSFPLYEILNKDIVDMKISSKMKEDIILLIEKDEECHEIIYALIKSYQVENETSTTDLYQIKEVKEGYKFNINKLPEKLQYILYKFSQKRYDELNRENEITKLSEENL